MESISRSAISTDGRHESLFNGLKIDDLRVGFGKQAHDGDEVTVEYMGWLNNGALFDSTAEQGSPLVFTIGKGEVIKGWEMGVDGMAVGGKRRLIVPTSLAYGPGVWAKWKQDHPDRAKGADLSAPLTFDITLKASEVAEVCSSESQCKSWGTGN
eukprot:CAMPEP_0175152960 /NCGR_PEP_ID=MMETSP0087-20121206/19438_2 /TAXON_ID=136419 /ORGANISM="Unknown Unknown, Strain D1" /LENGTH=154 /DNA_ID=CAMNT_0016439519 /DNA_START=296 /DNA_END=757 /DNA_ORIENTATION=-